MSIVTHKLNTNLDKPNMTNYRQLTVFVLAIILNSIGVAQALAQQEIRIPRSVQGDKGKYYLIERKHINGIEKILYKRIGVDTIVYQKTEVNCKTMMVRDIGSSGESIANIKDLPTKWFALVDGSSTSDMANFVCK
ncbi:MAG: hypothetical protein Q7T62_18355 [Undibacterium sp.]|nr:hypothetical protein [Undibacterium sp.]